MVLQLCQAHESMSGTKRSRKTLCGMQEIVQGLGVPTQSGKTDEVATLLRANKGTVPDIALDSGLHLFMILSQRS